MQTLPLRLQPGTLEIRSLAGTVAANGSLLALLPHWTFSRQADPATGYDQPTVRPAGQRPSIRFSSSPRNFAECSMRPSGCRIMYGSPEVLDRLAIWSTNCCAVLTRSPM